MVDEHHGMIWLAKRHAKSRAEGCLVPGRAWAGGQVRKGSL